MQSKIIVTAVGAFGLGALVGWAVTADIYENRFARERSDYDEMIGEKTQHIWALQDHIERTWSSGSNNTKVEFDPITASTGQLEFNEIEVEPVVEEEDEYEVPEGETPEETKTNLQNLIDAYTARQEEQEEEIVVNVKLTTTSNLNKTPPFVISKAHYAWDDEGESYEKITLTFYPRDRVLLDDEEDPIEDIAGTVGWRSLSQFGGESGDPDVVFVRNRRLETDFEIIKEENSRLPLHVQYGMEKEEFRANKAAGVIKVRQEDDDN
jgi:hypothetical protein